MSAPARALVAVALGLAVAGGGAPTPAAASPGSCDGVWVVVDGGDVSGTRCATSHSTGKEALNSAGWTTQDQTPGFLCRLGGYPAACRMTVDQYWAYWQASRNADGTWGPWRYSDLGYTATRPKEGDAEGWVFGPGPTGAPPPAPPASDTRTTPDPGRPADAGPADAGAAGAERAGTPGGLLATAGLLVVGGGALGGFWFARRRGA